MSTLAGTTRRRLAIAAVAVCTAIPAIAGAASGSGSHRIDVGNGRADVAGTARELPGSARTTGRLLQLTLRPPGAEQLAVDLGLITTEAARLGSLVSELYIEGARSGGESFPNVAYHSGGRSAAPNQTGTDVSLRVDNALLDSNMALARWRIAAGLADGAISTLDAASGVLAFKGIDFSARIGDRGLVSEVSTQRSFARFAATLDDLNVKLGNILPLGMLPLGTSLELATRLELPLGDELAASVTALTKLVDELRDVRVVLDEIDAIRATLDRAAAGHPALAAALANVDAAEAAAVRAANDLIAAAVALDAAQAAADAAHAAALAANGAVAAAQQDVASAGATVAGLTQVVAGFDAEIAALQAELLTAGPARLLQIPGEIAARQAARASAAAQLAAAQQAQAAANSALQTAQANAVARAAADNSAGAAAQAASVVVASKSAASQQAELDVLAAEAALAAAQALGGATASLPARQAALKARLAQLLQSISDVLASLPPLPVVQRELDEALRATPILHVGGLALESRVEAAAKGGVNKVHCTIEKIEILGYHPPVKTCADVIDASKEGVAKVNEVLRALGAVGVEGIEIAGPHGTWNQPAPDAAGLVRAEGRMSAFTLRIPSVRLEGVAANALAQVAPVLALIQQRQAAQLMLPMISPNSSSSEAARMGIAASCTPRCERNRQYVADSAHSKRVGVFAAVAPQDKQTLGGQLADLGEQLDEIDAPGKLQNLSTGGIDLVAAEAETVALFNASGGDIVDPIEYCDGDPVCIAACKAGACPPGGILNGGLRGSGGSKAVGGGSPAQPTPSGKLPVTGSAGGLAGLALLALAGLGATVLNKKRRPT